MEKRRVWKLAIKIDCGEIAVYDDDDETMYVVDKVNRKLISPKARDFERHVESLITKKENKITLFHTIREQEHKMEIYDKPGKTYLKEDWTFPGLELVDIHFCLLCGFASYSKPVLTSHMSKHENKETTTDKGYPVDLQGDKQRYVLEYDNFFDTYLVTSESYIPTHNGRLSDEFLNVIGFRDFVVKRIQAMIPKQDQEFAILTSTVTEYMLKIQKLVTSPGGFTLPPSINRLFPDGIPEEEALRIYGKDASTFIHVYKKFADCEDLSLKELIVKIHKL